MSGSIETVLELRNVSKRYGEISVLNAINFDLRAGEVHGLIGENGAGKSTTMKLLAGVFTDYEGELLLHGNSVKFSSPASAQDRGIGMVHQELSVFKHLTVAENIFSRALPTQHGFVKWKQVNEKARQYLRELGLEVDVTAIMGDLPIGMQQLVEIARIIFGGSTILILDEPTSALSKNETQRLFEFIAMVKRQGKSVIFISHFLEDVLAVTDRVTVFKNGNNVKTVESNETTKHELVKLMIGSEAKVLQQLYDEDRPVDKHEPTGDNVLIVEGLSRKNDFDNVSFSLRAGEILGFFGFMGAGQTGVAECLFGAKRADHGSVRLSGKKVTIRNTTQGRNAGIAYVPGNRHDSLMLHQEIYKNISLPHLHHLSGWIINRKKEIDVALELITRLTIKTNGPSVPVHALSGGNQQKVVLAKWLTRLPALLILNDPTRGIDVIAKDEILSIIKELRNKGVSILLITAEPEMILAIADRAVVMRRGCVTASLSGTELTKQNLMQHA